MKTDILPPPTTQTAIALAGLESVGKSAVFRALTGQATGDEQNVRGSTVSVRRGPIRGARADVVDLPGIRTSDDAATTLIALAELTQADRMLWVVRGTHMESELKTLNQLLAEELATKPVAIVVTFKDRASDAAFAYVQQIESATGIPVCIVNARMMSDADRQTLLNTIYRATPSLTQAIPPAREPMIEVEPQRSAFERPLFGVPLALAFMTALFAVPVFVAYWLADTLEDPLDALMIDPLTERLAAWPDFWQAMLMGDYGVISLGWYSFLWAFPVVLFIGMSVALAEECGLKDRITTALDDPLRRIGLHGRDLIPILTGFGCNVVAVFQTRGCAACTRKACVSMISFGSACSYQIGASLALFSVAGHPWLFAPYLLMLFVVGAIHTRIWNPALSRAQARPLSEAAFLQAPSWRAVSWRVRAVVKQFLLQAIPIFILICAVGAVLDYVGVLERIADAVTPALALFRLPGEVAPGVIFSIIRKDGLLVLNTGEGALLQSLTAGQVLVLVYFASTLTACLVTLWTIRKELGTRFALKIAGRQALTSVVSTLLLAWVIAR